MKKFMLLLIAGSLLGSSYFTINFRIFQLSLYRICIFIIPIMFLYSIKKGRKFNELKISRNYYSYKFIIFWIIYSMITLVWVKDYISWFKAITFITTGTLSIFFIGLTMSEEKDFHNIFRVIQVFVLGHSLLGYYEIFTGNYMFLKEKNQIYYSSITGSAGFRIPIGLFGNPNDYALFCLMGFYISIICFKLSKKYISKFFSMTLTISCAFLIFATQSRANFIGLLLSLLVYWIISINNSSILKKFLIAIFGIFSIVFIGLLIPDLYSSILPDLVTIDITGQNIESDFIRINLLKNGLIFLSRTFFAGVGLGNIEHYMQYDQVYYVGLTTDIHNWWFEILVSSGIFVFIGYIIMYFMNLRSLLKINKFSNNKNNIIIAKSFYSFLIGFIIASVSSSSIINKEWMWVLWGIIYAFVNFAYKDLSNK